jgi:Trk K+ transport system NAD-binding subunit
MVSLSVKLLNSKARVVARLHDIRNADKARRAGADEIVSPDFTGGMRIASAMIRPHVVNFMDQMLRAEEDLRVEEVVVPAKFAATRVADLLPRSRDFLLMATHERGRWVFNPADDHIVQPGSALVLMTSPGGRSQVSSCCGPDGRQMRQAGFDSRRASLAASRRSASGAESCGTSKLRKGWAIARSRIASLSAQRSDTRSSASRSS